MINEDQIRREELDRYLSRFSAQEAMEKEAVKEIDTRIWLALQKLPELLEEVVMDAEDAEELADKVLLKFSDLVCGV